MCRSSGCSFSTTASFKHRRNLWQSASNPQELKKHRSRRHTRLSTNVCRCLRKLPRQSNSLVKLRHSNLSAGRCSAQMNFCLSIRQKGEMSMSCHQSPKPVTRRQALSMIGGGFGLVAFSNMLNASLAQAATRRTHFKPRAKRVIFLFMNGGVSHVDTFDPKPMLEKYDGKPMPGPQILTQRKTGNLMKSPFPFKKYGESGTELSELWPNLGTVVDDICVIRSMWSEIPNHEPCITMMNTGANIIGRPSMGSWITYGLDNENLPGYVVLTPTEPLTIGSPLWSSAFLPAVYQGTVVHNSWVEDEPFEATKVIPNVMNPKADRELQSRDVGFLRHLNEMHLS